jgi:hypothetical protein
MLRPCFLTWQVGKRYHFVREFIEDGFIKIEFVRSDENDSDLCIQKLVKSYLKDTHRNFLNTAAITVPVDRHRIGTHYKKQFSFTC